MFRIRDEDDFQRTFAAAGHVECFFPVIEGELVGHDAFGLELAFGDPVNDRLEAIRAEVGAEQVEFLAVADDAPVDGSRSAEDAEFDETAEFADCRQALDDAGGVAGGFDVDVTAVALGHVHDGFDGVGLAGVDDDVSTELLGDFEAIVFHVHDDELLRILHAQVGDHTQAEGAGTGDDNDVFVADMATVDRMLGAGVGFDQRGLFDRQIFVDLVDQGALGQLHVFGHAAVDFFLETIDVMFLAHPVVAVFAEFAFPAGNDLVGNDAVAQLDIAFEIRADGDDGAIEFMARDERRANPGRLDFIAPEHRGAVVGLGVAGANAAGFDLDQNIAFADFLNRIGGFELVLGLAVGHESFHGFRNRHFLQSFCCKNVCTSVRIFRKLVRFHAERPINNPSTLSSLKYCKLFTSLTLPPYNIGIS